MKLPTVESAIILAKRSQKDDLRASRSNIGIAELDSFG
jgi:hypothetical protein